MRNKIIITSILAVILVAASFFIYSIFDETSPPPAPPPPPKIIAVYVSGQVKKTAVVRLKDNGNLRAVDAVNAAGGLTEFADTEYINLAEPLSDGMHIHIPTKDIFLQTATAKSINQPGITPNGLININTANDIELQNIRGVGPAIARRIIEYRELNGPFNAIDDIKKVRGIGTKTFDKMKDSITVN